jgi:hypothetical protein
MPLQLNSTRGFLTMKQSPLSPTRRQVLAGAAIGAAAAPLIGSFSVSNAAAAAPMAEIDRPTHRRFKLGEFDITTINDGAITLENPQAIFGTNASKEDFEAQAKAASCQPTSCRSVLPRSSSIPAAK